jgi:MFS family permease
MRRNDWIMVACGAIILTIGLGARQSFGIFQKPIAADLQVGRELWSFGNALSMLLMGALSPFVGGVADRFGAARTVAAGALLYVAGTVTMSLAQDGVVLTLGNAISGIGMAAAGMGPIMGVIGRNVKATRRSLTMGIVTAGGSFGQFAIVPFVSALQDRLGNWHHTMMILAFVSAVMVPLAIGLREPSRKGGASSGPAMSVRSALAEAFEHRGFWLLTLGFFVCGFHVAFVGLHLPAYISDKGIGLTLLGRTISPGELGGWAIGLVGLFNIAGAVAWGWLGGLYPRKDMLALLYFLRALVFALFLVLPLSAGSVLLFAATLGFLWLGTVPLTTGIVGFIFGPKYLSMLFGIVFFSHQVGSFLGGWGGGRLFDLFGNYDAMWWISIALGFAAALCNWPIRERPVARLAPQPA